MSVRALLGLTALPFAAFALAVGTPARSEEAPVESGSFELEAFRASFIGSAGYSKGTLQFRGSSHPFKVVGLGIGGFGVSKTRAWGGVYDLEELEDFTGTYVMARSGIAVGDEEVGNQRWVKNENGVKLELNVDTKGLQLNIGADGMVVSWDE